MFFNLHRNPQQLPLDNLTLLSLVPCKGNANSEIYSDRQKKFREDNGLISWTGRGGSDKLKQAVMDRLNPTDRANNTTENFQGLGNAALKAAKEKNKTSSASQSKHKKHQVRKPPSLLYSFPKTPATYYPL